MSGMGQLILLGGGGHAAVVAESARAAGWLVQGYLDDAPEAEIAKAAAVDLRCLGPIADLRRIIESADGEYAVHAAVGDGDLRSRWLMMALDLGPAVEAPPVFHPSAVISPSATLGRGVFIGPQAVINARAQIGDGAIINSGAIVEHDCRIGAWSHVAPGSVLGGEVTVGESALIGIGSSARPRVCIGPRAVVGAGAAVIGDVPAGVTVAGVPAAILDVAASRAGA